MTEPSVMSHSGDEPDGGIRIAQPRLCYTDGEGRAHEVALSARPFAAGHRPVTPSRCGADLGSGPRHHEAYLFERWNCRSFLSEEVPHDQIVKLLELAQ